jgi:hypothetical protein
MKVLICTLASGWYKNFAPLFEYTAKKHNPDCDVKVFYRKNMFPDHPDSATALLRFLIPNKYFEGYDYVYIADIDFVFLEHEPSMIRYHLNVMRSTGLSYSAYRGKIRHRGKKVWYGRDTRIAAGIVFVSRKWLEDTARIRTKVLEKIKDGMRSREQDEIMLYRIMRCAGIKTPKHRRRLYNGSMFDKNYRNLHLGDFRTEFKKRWKKIRKVRNWSFSDRSVKKYRKLCKDERYMRLVNRAKKEPRIKAIFKNLKWHLKRRSSV